MEGRLVGSSEYSIWLNQVRLSISTLHFNMWSVRSDLGVAWSLLDLCEFETRISDALTHLERLTPLGIKDDAEVQRVSTTILVAALVRKVASIAASSLLLDELWRGRKSRNSLEIALGWQQLTSDWIAAGRIDPSKRLGVGVEAVCIGGNINARAFSVLLQTYHRTCLMCVTPMDWRLAKSGRDKEAINLYA